jgi:hypothetical protein
MSRSFLALCLSLTMVAAGALSGETLAQSAAQSPYAKANRRDAIFLRFPEMAQRYWVDTETMAASHKSVAVPMPKQCSFVYSDAYTKGFMSEREVQDTAVSNCNRHLAELGPLGENYPTNCSCKIVISDDKYVVAPETMPEASPPQAYGPSSIFYRDPKGNVARLNGVTRYGALIGHDRSVTFSVENVRAEPVCEGTFTNETASTGRFSLSCFDGKFSGHGTYESKVGAPNDHIIARGSTPNGQPVVLVIGLPAQLAVNTYGGI